MLKIIYTLFLCLFFSPPCFAAPAIISTTGGIKSGENITITGTSFGTKATAAPLKYDFFEQTGGDYDVGDKPANGWVVDSDLHATYNTPKYNSTSTRSGSTKHIRCDWTKSPVDSHAPFHYDSGASQTYLYISFWAKMDIDGYTIAEPSSNVKWFSVLYSTEYGALYPGIRTSFGMTEAGASNKTSIAYMNLPNPYHSVPTDSVWVRCEYFLKESSTTGGTFMGVADGTMKALYQQGGIGNTFTEMFSEVDFKTNETEAYWDETDYAALAVETRHWRIVKFAAYNRNALVDMVIDWDDIYIDSTQARVEIGNENTFATCTHREIQIPTAWESDGTEITITMNQGSFSNGDTVFLYVVDSAGVVNTTGYEVIIGGGVVEIGGTKTITIGGTKTIEFQ